LLDHKRPLHLNVTTQDAFSFESKSFFFKYYLIINFDFFCKAFKRCVTTFLSRERECDENNTGQGNWSIIDQGVISFFLKLYMILFFFCFSIKQQ